MIKTTISGHTFIDILSSGAVVVDIGAHKGRFSKAISDRYACAIHSFEPWGQNFNELAEVMRNAPKSFLHQLAVVGTTPDHTTIRSYGNNGYSCSLLERSGGIYKKDGEAPVSVVTLDAVLGPMDHVDLLKLDCEGSEVDILMATSEAELRKCDQISVEFHVGKRGFKRDFTAEDVENIRVRMVEAGFDSVVTGTKNPDVLFFKPYIYFRKYDEHGAYHWDWYKRDFSGYRRAVDEVVGMFPNTGTVLDIGCGDGLIAERLRLHGLEVTGIDVSPTAIKLAKEKAPGVKFLESSFELVRGQCDYSLCYNVIEHVKDPEALLATVAATTKRFCILSTSCGDREKRDRTDQSVYTKAQLQEMFERAGLSWTLMRDSKLVYYKLEKNHGNSVA